MCGIAGVHRLTSRPFPELDRFAAALLDGIEERGQDATGFAAMNDAGDVQVQKASCRALYFNQHRGYIRPETRTLILHTRLATQGKPAFPENNHPVIAGDVHCVHNGHVTNDAELFRLSERSRVGQVDSEAIPALIASKGWDNRTEALESVEGAFAVALFSVKHPGELTLAKGDWSPLVYVQTRHLLVWASTRQAIENAYRAVLGSPPSYRRFEYLTPGVMLNVRNGDLSKGRFTVKREVYIPKKTVSTPSRIAVRYEWSEDGKLDRRETPLELPVSCDTDASADRLWVPATEDEEDGWDVLKCEDCGDWYDGDEMHRVELFGVTSIMCRACAEWAVDHAGAETAVPLAWEAR